MGFLLLLSCAVMANGCDFERYTPDSAQVSKAVPFRRSAHILLNPLSCR